MSGKVTVKFIFVFVLGATGFHASALDQEGNRTLNGVTLNHGSQAWLDAMRDEGLVALYLFRETSGQFQDTSGFGSPLNLILENPDENIPGSNVREVVRTGSSVRIDFPVLIRSQGAATKIIDECKSTGELTIEAWLQNANDGIRDGQFPLRRIVTLSNEVQNKRGDTPVAEQLSSANSNFYLSLNYDEGPTYKTSIRTSSAMDGVMLSTGTDAPDVPDSSKNKLVGRLQHVMVTKQANGVSKTFISYYDDQDNIIDNEYSSTSQDGLRSNFDNWDNSSILGIGNEISYRDNRANYLRVEDEGIEADVTTEQLEWIGEMHMLAIYCKAQTPASVLGDKAGGAPLFTDFEVNPDMGVSDSYKKAAILYKRLAGVSTSLANPIISDMAGDIAQGDLMGAAARVTEVSEFYNITVRDFAARMSNRAETVDAPLNDFIATVMGVVRDDINAKQLLTGDFYYAGDLTKASVAGNQISHMILSNQHYEQLEAKRFDLADVLVQRSPQVLYDGIGNTTPNFDAAGVLTTRAWMEAHASAGTNRRLVEFAFREFLCVPMEQWADAEAPDNFVGRDIDRFPAGDHAKYKTTCRSCHSVMDSLRGAFAYYDFSNGFVKNSFRLPASRAPAAETNSTSINLYEGTNVVTKMNHNDHTFPDGHRTIDNTFKNQAVFGANAAYFGWGEELEGAGVKQFGRMIANAQAFPFCMAKRVFRSACKRDPVAIDKALIESAANTFRGSNYNLKTLFQAVAISDECLGEDL